MDNTHPRYLYHPKIAPEGKVFNSADEEKELGKGWVDTPAKFPKPSKLSIWLKESFKPWWAEWDWLVKAFVFLLIPFAAFGKFILQFFGMLP